MRLFIAAVFISSFLNVNSETVQLKIAGIFDCYQLHESAFHFSNEIGDTKKATPDLQLTPLVISNINPADPFSALQGTCSFLKHGVVGIFGPQSKANLNIVQSIASRKKIPQVLTRWVDPNGMGPNTVNFYPSPGKLAKAFVDVIRKLEWRSFTVVYTDFENLVKMADLIKMAEEDGCLVYMENIDPYSTRDYRQPLRELMRRGQKNFLLDSPLQDLVNVLSQIQQVGMLTEDFSFVLTNLDAHTKVNTGEMDTFMHSGATIIGVRLGGDSQGIQSGNHSQNLCLLYKLTFNEECSTREMDIETASIIDAVHVFKDALLSAGVPQGRVMGCNGTESWEHGHQLLNVLKSGSYEGLTGTIEFGEDGFRSKFELIIYELDSGYQRIGSWATTSGLNLINIDTPEGLGDDLINQVLVVTMTPTEPYAMLAGSADQRAGKNKYEGFAVDLMEEISKYLGCHYVIVVRADSKHGAFDPVQGKWTGLIGDIVEGKADLAISDLTITEDRLEPVEFTHPFMYTGVGILFHKPQEKPPSFLYFASPFSGQVWTALGISYFATSLALFLIGRLSHGEWKSERHERSFRNQLTLSKSMWFTASTLFKQNSGVRMSSFAAGVVSMCWSCLCFVLIALYIAASFDAAAEKELLFHDVEDLVESAENHGLKFGALKGGATEAFFKNSRLPVYEEISVHMQEHPEDMVATTREGIERAEKGHYAFFMESATMEYTTRRHCRLASYGGLLVEKGFGIAVKQGSPLLTPLNKAILKLHTSGELLKIKQKWWEERNIEQDCNTKQTPEEKQAQKSLEHVQGILWITFNGIILAVLIAVIEFILNVRWLSKTTNQAFGAAFWQQLKTVFVSRRKSDNDKSDTEGNPTTTESIELL